MGDGFWRQFEVVGQEDQQLAVLGVRRTDPSEAVRIVGGALGLFAATAGDPGDDYRRAASVASFKCFAV